MSLFLPTPSHGGRRHAVGHRMTVSDFYPRPHMEGDGAGKKQIRAGKDFYPRPHMEGDLADLPPMVDFKAISTHALTWRATIYLRVPDIEGIGFLPTPSHGGRPKGSVFALPLSNFYPRPHMEGDPFKFLSVDYLRVISTHALTWRATCGITGETTKTEFLPTPSHGGRLGWQTAIRS